MIYVSLQVLFSLFTIVKFIVYFTNARCKSKTCLVGKTALITGGNSGIGLQLAKELASRGCTIIIADKDDATSTVAKLVKETHNSNIYSKIVDFASLKSVRLFADELNKNIEKLHILVNNAGIADLSLQKTEDGIQKIMQVNYFSHFLLTHLLLVRLLESSPSRIIYTSSIAAYITFASEKDFKQPTSIGMFNSGPYGNAKLAGAIMSRILAKKLKNTGITSNALHPGIIKTNIWNTVKKRESIRVNLFWVWTCIFGKNAEEGVETLLHLACANEVENVSGKYFMECIPVWQPKQVYDPEFCNIIWELSEKYVHLKPEEKLDSIIQQWQTNHSNI